MDVQTVDNSPAGPASAPAAAAVATPPAASPPPAASLVAAAPAAPAHREDTTLHHTLSQLAGGGSLVDVSFKISHDPNEIVTVFKNATTGETIAQFPSETMVMIAQFFDQLSGATLDRSA